MNHIELLGPPGSGKTTLANALIAAVPEIVPLDKATLMSLRSGAGDYPTRALSQLVGSPSNRLWRWAYARSPDRFDALGRALASHAELTRGVADAQTDRSARDSRPDVVWDWFLNLLARFQLAAEVMSEDGALLLDEGFCQRAVAIFGYGFADADRSHVDEYVHRIPRPDLVIVVESPVEVCEARLDRRGWTARAAHAEPTIRRDFLKGSVEVVQTVARGMEERGARVVDVDGTTPVEIAISRIVATMDE